VHHQQRRRLRLEDVQRFLRELERRGFGLRELILGLELQDDQVDLGPVVLVAVELVELSDLLLEVVEVRRDDVFLVLEVGQQQLAGFDAAELDSVDLAVEDEAG